MWILTPVKKILCLLLRPYHIKVILIYFKNIWWPFSPSYCWCNSSSDYEGMHLTPPRHIVHTQLNWDRVDGRGGGAQNHKVRNPPLAPWVILTSALMKTSWDLAWPALIGRARLRLSARPNLTVKKPLPYPPILLLVSTKPAWSICSVSSVCLKGVAKKKLF